MLLTAYFYVFHMSFRITAIISVNSINQLILVIVKCCVFFEVRTEFLDTIETSFNFKRLICSVTFNSIFKMGVINYFIEKLTSVIYVKVCWYENTLNINSVFISDKITVSNLVGGNN
jgi:hypothetical protein